MPNAAISNRFRPSALIVWLFGATMFVLPHIHDTTALTVFALIVAGALVVAWKTKPPRPPLPAAGAFVAIMFASWAVQASPDFSMVPGSTAPGLAPKPTDEVDNAASLARHLLALAFGATGFLAQGRASTARIATLWSAAGTATPLLILIALYARIAHLDQSIPFAIGRARAGRSLRLHGRATCASRARRRPANRNCALCDRLARGTRIGADICSRERAG